MLAEQRSRAGAHACSCILWRKSNAATISGAKVLVPTFAADTAWVPFASSFLGADADFPAVASRLAANLYGGRVVARGIEDDPSNYTRFLAIGPGAKRLAHERAPRGHKTSLAFVLPNRSGALFKALGCFSLRDIDLAKLESRPMRGRPFEYLFYVDALSEPSAPAMRHALDHLHELAEKVWLLGSYARAISPTG